MITQKTHALIELCLGLQFKLQDTPLSQGHPDLKFQAQHVLTPYHLGVDGLVRRFAYKHRDTGSALVVDEMSLLRAEFVLLVVFGFEAPHDAYPYRKKVLLRIDKDHGVYFSKGYSYEARNNMQGLILLPFNPEGMSHEPLCSSLCMQGTEQAWRIKFQISS